ncbi:Nuclear transcription factor Y subunit B-8 [Hibiscus syriacus]|uniref:Nuclear transcription factor Y subunit B-8 n=1 Tax=Hibiscus syriacus TaxID=106335 RepID=A0A6A3D676_HIBSY|nr:Nuclear transcription factor Y subunit B-8 [Hibiscus syriacus]
MYCMPMKPYSILSQINIESSPPKDWPGRHGAPPLMLTGSTAASTFNSNIITGSWGYLKWPKRCGERPERRRRHQGADRLLPIANVGRIMKQMLPPNAKISKEAKETMQECVSEFIGFITSEAGQVQKREAKDVNGDDVCCALAALGFDDYAAPLRRYLDRYRELEGDNKAVNPGKVNNRNNNEDKEEQSSLKFSMMEAVQTPR